MSDIPRDLLPVNEILEQYPFLTSRQLQAWRRFRRSDIKAKGKSMYPKYYRFKHLSTGHTYYSASEFKKYISDTLIAV